MNDLRTAAQMALDALEEIHPGNMTPMAEQNWNKAIEALRAALAQGAQEPVAYMYDFYSPDDPTEIIRDWVAQSLDEVKRCGGVNIRPLYLAATQREWQGLTDEEAFDAFGFHLWPESFLANVSQELKDTHEEAKKEVLSKVRVIEAKLKEKNHAV